MTSAADMAVAAGNMVSSTGLKVPPENCVAFTFESANVNGFGIVPCGLIGACWSSEGGAATPR